MAANNIDALVEKAVFGAASQVREESQRKNTRSSS